MERGNKAMLERKSLLQAKKIKKGFVEYPVTLQVMRSNSHKYTKYAVF